MGLGKYIREERSSSIGTSSRRRGMGFAHDFRATGHVRPLVLAGEAAYLGFIVERTRDSRDMSTP